MHRRLPGDGEHLESGGNAGESGQGVPRLSSGRCGRFRPSAVACMRNRSQARRARELASRWRATTGSSSTLPPQGRRRPVRLRISGRCGRAGRDRRPHRPAAAAAHVRRSDADRQPGPVRVYYVDDHFVPTPAPSRCRRVEQQARPGGKGPRGHPRHRARRAGGVLRVRGTVRADRHLAEGAGRAEESRRRGATIMLGFDRGGAYPQVFTHCREQDVHWVTYRRAPLAVPAALPVITTITVGGKNRQVAWAEEKVQLKDYGEARQLTLFEHGKVVLQILTSDFDSCPADILGWLKSRWREENFLKYAAENYGIDKICDYAAEITVNTKITANPARKAANAAVRAAEKDLAAAERALAALLADRHHRRAGWNGSCPITPASIRQDLDPKSAADVRKRPLKPAPKGCGPHRTKPVS